MLFALILSSLILLASGLTYDTGDIVFFHGGGPEGLLIEKVTNTNYSHIAIYFEDDQEGHTWLWMATGPGVYLYNFNEYMNWFEHNVTDSYADLRK